MNDFLVVEDVLFTCNSCGWVGSELELDVISNFDNNLVCCPSCPSDDVRVFNDQKVS
ncbi:MAG: hypothetical protein OCD00_02010 [Colwellia sp.]